MYTIPVFNNDRPGPSLQDRTIAIGMKAFIVVVTNGITSQTARPILNHKLLTAFGYPQDMIRTMATDNTWEQVYTRITDTAPRHTLEPLFACIWTAEIQAAE
jgi:hypothetical protein